MIKPLKRCADSDIVVFDFEVGTVFCAYFRMKHVRRNPLRPFDCRRRCQVCGVFLSVKQCLGIGIGNNPAVLDRAYGKLVKLLTRVKLSCTIRTKFGFVFVSCSFGFSVRFK